MAATPFLIALNSNLTQMNTDLDSFKIRMKRLDWSTENPNWNIRMIYEFNDYLPILFEYYDTIGFFMIPYDPSTTWTAITPTMIVGTNQLTINYVKEESEQLRIRFTKTSGAAPITVIPLHKLSYLSDFTRG